jgi:hypothetical protein
MSVQHVVVDGSNIATEGRTLPSLQQLDEAVRSFIEQYEPNKVTVVVDASFPNRIDAGERATYEEAILAGELVTPPAGVIGRGDAFLLEISDRAGAVVLSNDSFQEFHGQFEWLFEQGRLIGGKPVPHVGWVFMERAPVRGPTSRRAVSDAKKAKRKAAAAPAADGSAAGSAPDGAAPTTKSRRRRKADSAPESAARADAAPAGGSKRPGRSTKKAAAPVAAADLASSGGGRRRRRAGSDQPAGVQPYNEALQFIEFVSAHPVGSAVQGEVEQFSSHGAYVMVDGTRCYLPLKHMADPPPRSAREMLQQGEQYTFEVHAFDTPRRGVDLALPGVVSVPEPDVGATLPDPEPAAATAADPVHQPTEEERVAPAKKKATSKRSTAKRSAAKKAAGRKTTARKSPAKKSTAKKSTARKSTAKKSPAKKAARKSTAKKSTAKKSTAKKAARKSTAKKKSAAKKSTAKKSARKSTAKKSR